jgi:hypothetical protein
MLHAQGKTEKRYVWIEKYFVFSIKHLQFTILKKTWNV